MRVLVVTAVPVERDAVTRAFGGAPGAVARGGCGRGAARDALAAGARGAAGASAEVGALASAWAPYGLVGAGGVGGACTPLRPLGSLVVARDLVAADLGADTRDGFLPVTALAGAVFLVWVDTLARTVLDPQEIPVGVVTAMIGVPAFVLVLYRTRSTS